MSASRSLCAALLLASTPLVTALGCEPEPSIPGPTVPRIAEVDSPTNQRLVTLRGTKESATALVINGNEVLPLSEAVTFEVEVELDEGGNVFLVSVADARDQRSGAATVSITLDSTPPDAPSLDPIPPRTVRAQIAVTGNKPADAVLYMNGDAQPAANGAASFDLVHALGLGDNAVRISTMDALANESAIVEARVERFDALPFSLDAPLDGSIQTVSTATLSGTRGPGVTVLVNGAALADDVAGGAWTTDVPLTVGANTIVVGAHFAGEASEIEEQTITVHYHPIPDPPALDAAPARAGATVTITGTKPANTAIERGGVEVVPLGPETTFSDDAPLAAEGTNTLSYVAVSEYDQRSSAVTVDVIRDTTAPSLTLDPALAGSLVGDLVDVAGVASDADPALVVEVCVGTCALDVDFAPVSLSGGAFDDILDLAARADLTDGAYASVHARATDSLALRTEVSVDVLLSRASVPTLEAAGTTLALASTGDPFVLAWVAIETSVVVLTQDEAPPVGGFVTEVVSDPAALAIGAPRIAMSADGSGFVAFAEASARTSSATTTRGVLAVPFDADGAAAPLVVVDASGGDAVAVDVALLSTGEAAVASVVADVVRVSLSSAGAFAAPVAISDATTAGVTDVRVVAGPDDVLTVAWIETSARDGVLDDADVVARRFTPGVGPDATVLLVTATGGAFVDAGADTLALTALPASSPADVAVVGTINAGEAWLFSLGGAALVVSDTARISPAGDALALSLAPDPAGVLAAVLDGGALLGGAPAPGVVAVRGDVASLGAPLVVSTQASSLPTAAAGHVGFVDSRGVIVRALLETP